MFMNSKNVNVIWREREGVTASKLTTQNLYWQISKYPKFNQCGTALLSNKFTLHKLDVQAVHKNAT